MHSLIIGGYHSGKTERALSLVSKNKNKINYITTKPIDDEINSPINIIECEDNLPSLIESLSDSIIIDDIASLFSSIVQDSFKSYDGSKDNLDEIEKLIRAKKNCLLESIKKYSGDMIIISSIVGLGLIPPTKEERLFRDELGFFNQELSKHCKKVEMVVAGIATTIKDNTPPKSSNGKGTLYGVSVGPGNEEMLTLQAIKTLNAVSVFAIPETKTGNTVALDIISNIVNMDDKEIIKFQFPMTYDLKKCDDNYREVAKLIANMLEKGLDIAMPVLGDIAIYSTFANFAPYVEELGYEVKVISGIPSFIAAADAFNMKLIKGSQTLTILSCKDPQLKEKLQRDGKKVIMKIGKQLPMLKDLLIELKLDKLVHIALNVGMENQRLLNNLSEISDTEGSFALVLVDVKET